MAGWAWALKPKANTVHAAQCATYLDMNDDLALLSLPFAFTCYDFFPSGIITNDERYGTWLF